MLKAYPDPAQLHDILQAGTKSPFVYAMSDHVRFEAGEECVLYGAC